MTSEIAPDVQARLTKLSVCAIADAMAKLKIKGHILNVTLARGFSSATDVCGPALTVQVVPATNPSLKKLPFHYVDKVEKGQVIVVSTSSSTTSGVFGGLLTAASKARGAVGVVTDGYVRDVQEISAMEFPVFSRGTSVHGQQGSTIVLAVNGPIVLGGCVVRRGDIIRGDTNGVLVIPVERASEVAAEAENIEKQDNKIAEAVKKGAGLYESMKRFRSRL